MRLILVTVLCVAGCNSQDGPASNHSPDRLRFAVTDVEGMEQLQIEFGAFRDLLAAKTGLDLQFFAVSSRTAAAEALAHGKLDLVLTGPAEYVIFQSRTAVKPIIALVRPDYYAVIVARSDSALSDLAELRGEKVAMGSVGSTSKHLAPVAMFADAGLDLDDDVEIVHVPIRTGWEMLQRDQVKAFATTNDKFALLRDKANTHKVRVIAKSGQLPNDVLLARDDLAEKVVQNIRTAIAGARGEFVSAILQGTDNQKYREMRFDVDVRDRDYDAVRKMFTRAGLSQFVVNNAP